MQRLMTIEPRLSTHPVRQKLSPWYMRVDNPAPRAKGENLRLFMMTWVAGFLCFITMFG